MALIVKKFGGSSVKDAEHVFNVAGIIVDEYKRGNDVIVVVSAQGDTTDDLIEKAKEINPSTPLKREMDMLLTSGEQISIALLAMAIDKLGCPVISLLGWQAGFSTDSHHGKARIKKINTERMKTELLLLPVSKDLISTTTLQHSVEAVLTQALSLLQLQ